MKHLFKKKVAKKAFITLGVLFVTYGSLWSYFYVKNKDRIITYQLEFESSHKLESNKQSESNQTPKRSLATFEEVDGKKIYQSNPDSDDPKAEGNYCFNCYKEVTFLSGFSKLMKDVFLGYGYDNAKTSPVKCSLGFLEAASNFSEGTLYLVGGPSMLSFELLNPLNVLNPKKTVSLLKHRGNQVAYGAYYVKDNIKHTLDITKELAIQMADYAKTAVKEGDSKKICKMTAVVLGLLAPFKAVKGKAHKFKLLSAKEIRDKIKKAEFLTKQVDKNRLDDFASSMTVAQRKRYQRLLKQAEDGLARASTESKKADFRRVSGEINEKLKINGELYKVHAGREATKLLKEAKKIDEEFRPGSSFTAEELSKKIGMQKSYNTQALKIKEERLKLLSKSDDIGLEVKSEILKIQSTMYESDYLYRFGEELSKLESAKRIVAKGSTTKSLKEFFLREIKEIEERLPRYGKPYYQMYEGVVRQADEIFEQGKKINKELRSGTVFTNDELSSKITAQKNHYQVALGMYKKRLENLPAGHKDIEKLKSKISDSAFAIRKNSERAKDIPITNKTDVLFENTGKLVDNNPKNTAPSKKKEFNFNKWYKKELMGQEDWEDWYDEW